VLQRPKPSSEFDPARERGLVQRMTRRTYVGAWRIEVLIAMRLRWRQQKCYKLRPQMINLLAFCVNKVTHLALQPHSTLPHFFIAPHTPRTNSNEYSQTSSITNRSRIGWLAPSEDSGVPPAHATRTRSEFLIMGTDSLSEKPSMGRPCSSCSHSTIYQDDLYRI
jgi:hypothetical protein